MPYYEAINKFYDQNPEADEDDEFYLELEKDIRLDDSAPIHEVTLAYRNNSYDYSPDAVYGLVRKKFTGEDLSED